MSRTLATIVIIFAAIIFLPIAIGVFGGLFGIVVGIFGAVFGVIAGIFGAIFGVIGTMFGAIGGIIGFIFHSSFIALIIVCLIVIVASKSRSRR